MRNGWVTDQHGSWSFGFVPLLVGLIVSRHLGWAHVLLVLAWTAGFFLFAVAEKWLKFRFKPRFRPALITYALATAVFGLLLVIAQPIILWWALLFGPLVAAYFYLAWARRERELVSRLTAIAAAALILAVADNLGTAKAFFATGGVSPRAWLLTFLLALYFAGTVPLVKTLIRERGNPRWFVGSMVFHVIATVIMALLSIASAVPWAHVGVWLLATLRAWYLPTANKRRGRPFKPSQVGAIELVFTLLMVATLPW